MSGPFDRPETINWYGSQHVGWGKHAVVVDDDPDATQDATERPVTVEDVNGEEKHRKTGHYEVGNSQIADQDGEICTQLFLELVRQQDKQVGGSAHDDNGE